MAIQHYFDRAKVDYDETYEAGKKAQYDEFWDSYQNYGNRKNYLGAFCGIRWHRLFAPKYSMQPTNAYMMFRNFGPDWDANDVAYIDLAELLKQYDVTLDFSKCTDMGGTFQGSYITRVGVIDCTSCSMLSITFASMTYLATIECLKINENTKFDRTFTSDTNLVNLTIEGMIGQNGFDIHWSTKLSKVSITSVINALSTTTSGLTATFSKTAVETAFGSTTSTEWLSLVATKSNWTISLV